MSYRDRLYEDTTYDTVNSLLEKYRRERQRVNIAIPGLENGIPSPPKACHDHPHIPIQYRKSDGKPFCRDCGFIEEKPQPTKPNQQTKVKQKSTAQSKSFITQLPDRHRQKRGGFIGAEDGTSELSDSEMRWISQMYGNIVDGSDSG